MPIPERKGREAVQVVNVQVCGLNDPIHKVDIGIRAEALMCPRSRTAPLFHFDPKFAGNFYRQHRAARNLGGGQGGGASSFQDC